MSPGEDGLAADARAHLAPFLGWLAKFHPELGIDERTNLEGTPGSWVLVIDHYQFLSEEWEIGLAWHVMIPPDDWARIYLRRRWSEVRPARAFEFSSVSSGAEPHEIDPPGRCGAEPRRPFRVPSPGGTRRPLRGRHLIRQDP
jgi:hypothetical protein